MSASALPCERKLSESCRNYYILLYNIEDE